jgi:hypothetical protein
MANGYQEVFHVERRWRVCASRNWQGPGEWVPQWEYDNEEQAEHDVDLFRAIAPDGEYRVVKVS